MNAQRNNSRPFARIDLLPGNSPHPNQSLGNAVTCVDLHIKCQLFLLDFDQIRNVYRPTHFSKFSNTKFHENPFSGSSVVSCCGISFQMLAFEDNAIGCIADPLVTSCFSADKSCHRLSLVTVLQCQRLEIVTSWRFFFSCFPNKRI
jgi:hypothetical protein